MADVKIGLVTVSDRASQGIYEDKGGPAMLAEMSRILSTAFVPVRRVIADEQPLIQSTLKELADIEQCCLILTTGGTGPARRDVTPEATAAVCDRLLDGFGEQMRAVSLKVVPTAILSCQIAGTRGKALIINLPGNPPAIKDCLEAVMPAVPYCIDLMEGPWLDFRDDCGLKAFRPKHAKKPGA